jgi:hypothetical protein
VASPFDLAWTRGGHATPADCRASEVGCDQPEAWPIWLDLPLGRSIDPHFRDKAKWNGQTRVKSWPDDSRANVTRWLPPGSRLVR